MRSDEAPRAPSGEGCARCASETDGAPTGGDASPVRRRGILRALATAPAAVLALLPSFSCPACLAAYTGVLSSLGLSFMLNERVLAPLIVVFLLLGIVSVGRARRSHGNRGPIAVTLAASALIVVGRLIWHVPPVLYLGAGLLIAATLWNLWLKRPKHRPAPSIAAGAN